MFPFFYARGLSRKLPSYASRTTHLCLSFPPRIFFLASRPPPFSSSFRCPRLISHVQDFGPPFFWIFQFCFTNHISQNLFPPCFWIVVFFSIFVSLLPHVFVATSIHHPPYLSGSPFSPVPWFPPPATLPIPPQSRFGPSLAGGAFLTSLLLRVCFPPPFSHFNSSHCCPIHHTLSPPG